MAIILGIDPGSRVTGYGVIRQVGRQLSYLGSGCIRTKVDDLPSRLKLIYAGVTEIITQFQPDYFAIEQVFMAKNADSALKLGQARGVAIVAAVNQELPVFEYAARQVKQTVVGDGNRQRISGIRLWISGQFQQGADHMLHLAFFGTTNTYHRLLYLTCRVFKYRQFLIHRRNNRHAARLAQFQG